MIQFLPSFSRQDFWFSLHAEFAGWNKDLIANTFCRSVREEWCRLQILCTCADIFGRYLHVNITDIFRFSNSSLFYFESFLFMIIYISQKGDLGYDNINNIFSLYNY